MEKVFFDLPIKKEEEAYEKIIDMSNNNGYTTGNLLDLAYFKESYRLIAIDLSKQAKLKDPQQISFIDKLLNRHRATVFFIMEKSEEITFNFSRNSPTIIWIRKIQKIVNLLNGSDNGNSKFATKNGMLLSVSQRVINNSKIKSNF